MTQKGIELKKALSLLVAFTMVATGGLAATLAVSPNATMNAEAAEPVPDDEATSIRIYGEHNATYPTQSYTDRMDFIYPNHIDPLDPGIISKDSVTFNPAYLNARYDGAEQLDDAITVDGQDSDEKIYLRMFYEPHYNHSIDDKMSLEYESGLNPVKFDQGAIVMEYTYMLLDAEGMPTAAHGNLENPQNSHFMLPVRSSDDTVPGMEDADMVNLPWAGYNWAGACALNPDPDMMGAINVSQKYTNIDTEDAAIEFMDHEIKYEGLDVDNDPLFTISYAGNMPERNEEKTKQGVQLYDMDETWFDRSNGKATTTDPAHRWWAQVTAVRANGNIDLRVGRLLVAGETFYVNGVRYDMPAIHVEDADSGDGVDPVFKYITFQTPIPKGEPYCTDTADWSHVTSQWLKNLPPERNMWVAPPFNHEHIMIDDIGLDKDDFGEYYPLGAPQQIQEWIPNIEIPVTGLILDEIKDPLEFYYIAETIEPRFNTSLAEIANWTSWTNPSYDESWTWYNVYTMPMNYTEFILPNQEAEGEAYTEEYYGNEIPNWYTADADGAEYLITTSWISPNSWGPGDDVEADWWRDGVSKELYPWWHNMYSNEQSPDPYYFWDLAVINGWIQHDIVDRTLMISLPEDQAEASRYYWMPRMVFEFDAVNGTDIYVNENSPTPSLRVYGDSFLSSRYPNQVWVDACYRGGDYSLDFVYTDLYQPFDPAVIEKDCVTFNSAYMNARYGGAEQLDDAITVDGQDCDEKVHLRMFYQPNYRHPIDELMSQEYETGLDDVEFDHGAVVLEYTYQLLDAEGMPIAAHGNLENPQDSHFMLPVRSSDDTVPGMEDADMVNLPWVNFSHHTGEPRYIGPPVNPYMDGAINVSQKYTNIDTEDDAIEFMDHEIKYEGLDVDNDPLFTISYAGNMPERNEEKTKQGVQLYGMNETWFDRSNGKATTTDQAHRWWAQVTAVRANGNIDLRVGRLLVAGETFYVNGVRYDMPAIYVENVGGDYGTPEYEPVFKYITLQTPIPKGEPYCTDTADWSHVTSQWLKNLPPEYDAWVLPPFNEQHIMIDDIGLEKVDRGEWVPYGNNGAGEYWKPDIEIPTSGLILDEIKDPLEFYYIAETIEPRFNTSLAERFNYSTWGPNEGEYLTWYNVYTMPNEYTEFVLPDQESEGEAYTEEYYGNEIPTWYPWDADGAEYLLTSSWIAKNSNTSWVNERGYPGWKMVDSKPSWDQHDINCPYISGHSLHKWWSGQVGYAPRMTFEFDAYNGTGLYLNGAEGAGPSDWNPWDDDGVVTLTELQEAIDHWVNDIPKNDHLITLSELQDLVDMWLTS